MANKDTYSIVESIDKAKNNLMDAYGKAIEAVNRK